MRIITVYNKKGGSGCTRITTKLAERISKVHEKQAAIVYFATKDKPPCKDEEIPCINIPYRAKESDSIRCKTLLQDVIPTLSDTEYLLLDIPKSYDDGIYKIFIESLLPLYTIIPTDNDPMSISCTEEVVNELNKNGKKYSVILNNVSPDGEMYARSVLYQRRIKVFDSAILRECEEEKNPFHLSEGEILDLLYLKIKNMKIYGAIYL